MNYRIPQLSSLVVSLLGHDRGRAYIVTKVDDGNFVYVCDGIYRTIDKPKRKRFKHLKVIEEITELNQKILDGKIRDEDIKRFIKTTQF